MALFFIFVFCVSWTFLFYIGYLFSKKAAIIDVGWSLCIPFVSWFAYYFFGETSAFHFVLLIALTIWGARLAFLLINRLLNKQHDLRYLELEQNWKGKEKLFFFFFFLFQGIAAAVLALPMLYAIQKKEPVAFFVFFLACVWFLVSFLGEGYADWIMARFRKNPENKGKICREGIWNYSRHPNYFFEWNIWVAYGFFAWSFGVSPWWAFSSAAIMLFFILFVTGVPPTEKQLLKSKGNAYRQYQQEVSVFFPWFSADKE